MMFLRTLGSVSVEVDGDMAGGAAQRRMPLALLALLAASGRQGMAREKVAALLWPESDAERARALLKQNCYELRRDLASPELFLGATQLHLNPAIIASDVQEVLDALEKRDWARAAAAHTGAFLDGFHVGAGGEFERWVDDTRVQLRRGVAQALEHLAQSAESSGDASTALRWWLKLATLEPLSSRAAVGVVQGHVALGDRAAAVAFGREHERLVRQDLGVEADVRVTELLAKLQSGPRSAAAPTRTEGAPAAPRTITPLQSRRSNRGRYLIAAFATVLILVGVRGSLLPRGLSPGPVTRFPLEFAGAPPLASGVGGSTIVLSPNGEQLVYLGAVNQNTQLLLRAMDRLEALPIPHTDGARHPFFSPDGKWLGFVSGNTIRRVRVDGGPPITVCALNESVAGVSWGGRNLIVFATPSGLWQVSADGGIPTILARSDTVHGERYRWPEFLPRGKTVVFTSVKTNGMQLVAVSVDEHRVTTLGVEGTNPHFVAPGYLVYARMDGALLAARFDEGRVRVTGAALPIAEAVWVGSGGAAKLGVSRAGTLAYVPVASDNALVNVTRAGRAESIAVPAHDFRTVRYSPDGRRIATVIRSIEEHQDIWIVEPAQARVRRLTFDTGSVSPVWTPDGREIVFASMRAGREVGFALRSIASDGAGAARTLLTAEIGQLPQAVTPDGRSLLFQREHPERKRDVWILPLQGEATPRPYLRSKFDEKTPVVSPDGHWVAYSSDESGRDEVYVVRFPEPGARVQLTSGGGSEPRWAPSGRSLFYRGPSGMMAVNIRSGTAPSGGRANVLFADAPYLSWRNTTAYDIHPAGERFVMIRQGDNPRRIVVVLNWFASSEAARGR